MIIVDSARYYLQRSLVRDRCRVDRCRGDTPVTDTARPRAEVKEQQVWV